MVDFRVRVELGRNASPAEVAAVHTAVGALCDAAAEWAFVEAEAQVDARLRRQALYGPQATLLPSVGGLAFDEDEQQELNVWLNAQMLVAREVEARRDAGQTVRFTPVPASWLLPYPAAVRRWRSRELAELLPATPTLTRAAYNNPVELVIAAAGGAALAFGWLLGQVRDFQPRRRIASAAAADAEDIAAARKQLRQRMLQLHADGQLTADPAEIMRILGEAPMNAVIALQRLDASVIGDATTSD